MDSSYRGMVKLVKARHLKCRGDVPLVGSSPTTPTTTKEVIMFTPKDVSIIKNMAEIGLAGTHEQHMNPYASGIKYWDQDGDDATFLTTTNVSLCTPRCTQCFYIDVFSDSIEFDLDMEENPLIFSTLIFTEGTDEEFFQLSTVTDFDGFDIDMLKPLVRISLMVRSNIMKLGKH